jgi:hypothetical protein
MVNSSHGACSLFTEHGLWYFVSSDWDPISPTEKFYWWFQSEGVKSEVKESEVLIGKLKRRTRKEGQMGWVNKSEVKWSKDVIVNML